MSTYPETYREMLRASYKRLNSSATCPACGEPIEWWETTHGKKLPLNPPDHNGVLMRHNCPKRPARIEPTPVDNLSKRLGFIRSTQHARAIVMIDKDGEIIAAWAKNIPAEDLRTDLISAANFVRAEVLKEGR